MIDTHARVQPTRRLLKAELAVFRRILGEFPHLQASDSELLTQFAEATNRYESALKEIKKRPEIETTIVSGRKEITKKVRNPAHVTLKQAQQAMVSLSRRLLIDAASVEKRMKLLTKKAFATGETVDDFIGDGNFGFAEEQVQSEMDLHRDVYRDEPILRRIALDHLSTRRYIDAATDEDLGALLSATVS